MDFHVHIYNPAANSGSKSKDALSMFHFGKPTRLFIHPIRKKACKPPTVLAEP